MFAHCEIEFRRGEMMSPLIWFLIFAVGFVSAADRHETHVEIVDGHEEGHYNAKVHLKDQVVDLKLSPIRDPIFAKGFKFQLSSTDKDGKLVVQDVTPSIDKLSQVHQDLYADKTKNTVVRVKRDSTGHKLDGILYGHVISFDGNKHYVIPEPRLAASIRNPVRVSYADESSPDDTKYLPEIHWPWTPTTTTTPAPPPQPIRINAEIALVISSEDFNEFNKDVKAVIEYFAVFFHSVNEKFGDMKSKQIKIKTTIVGILANQDANAEPYLTQCYQDGGGTECSVTQSLLAHFGRWTVLNNDKLPQRDILVLVHNAVNKADEWGAAFVRGACIKDTTDPNLGRIDASTAAVKDYGRAYAGVHTMVHEIGHNFGASHDGQVMTGFDPGNPKVDATSCPQKLGYIMSYVYGVPEKFYFSKCSINNMTNYLLSGHAQCLQIDQYQAWWKASSYGGDFLTMHEQCIRLFPDNGIGVWTNFNLRNLDDQCIQLQCATKGVGWGSKGYYPIDRSPCGINGVCKRGKCVPQKGFIQQCQDALKNDQAIYATQQSPDNLCGNLECVDPAKGTQTLVGPALPYTPCGQNGRCINGTCQVQVVPKIPTLRQQCQFSVMNPQVTETPYDPANPPADICNNLWCSYPGQCTNRLTIGIPPLDFTQCGPSKDYFCYRARCANLDTHLQRTDLSALERP